MSKTNFILILLFSLTVLASGCLDGQQEVTGVVETLPEVQEFLDDNPDASIDAVRWNSDYIDDNFDDIKETCQPAIDTEKDHYRVNVEDDSENIVTWLEAEEMEVMCVTREGSETTSEEETEEETAEPESEKLTESDIEGDITEVTIDGGGADPSRPEITQEEGVEFVNNAGFDIRLEFDADRYEEIVIEDGESKIKDFQRIIYYQITPVDEDVEYRTPGGTGVNVVESSDFQDCSQINIEVTNVDEDSEEMTMSQTAGQAGAGEVTVSWFFDEGEPVRANYSLGGETEEEPEDTPRESVSINPNDAEDGELEVNGQTITVSGDIEDAEGLEEVSLDPVDCEGASTASWSR